MTIKLKSVLVLVMLLTLNLKAQTFNQISGKIDEEQLKFLKENYNWNDENIVVINFLQPISNCHYDAYENLSNPSKWWTNFYSKIDLTNVANRFVYSDANAARRIIDSKIYFGDVKNFILNNFFSKEPQCHGVLVINNFGFYEMLSREYSEKEVTFFIKILKNKNK